MRTMSLFETGDSNGCVSLESIFSEKIKPQKIKEVTLKDLIHFCVGGGWPAVIGENDDVSLDVVK